MSTPPLVSVLLIGAGAAALFAVVAHLYAPKRRRCPRCQQRTKRLETMCYLCAHGNPGNRRCEECVNEAYAKIEPWGLSAARGGAPATICAKCGTVAMFKCPKCAEEFYDYTQSMAHSNQRFAPVVRVMRAALKRIAACAKWAGAEGHGDYRDIEVDATDALAVEAGGVPGSTKRTVRDGTV